MLRPVRIVPPSVAAILVAAARDAATGTSDPWTDYPYEVMPAGHLIEPQIIGLGVAWPLVIEVPFYTLIVLLSPLLNSRRLASAVALGTAVVLLVLVALVVLVVARDFGASFFLFAAAAAYLPVLQTDRAVARVGTALRMSIGGSESALPARKTMTPCLVPT